MNAARAPRRMAASLGAMLSIVLAMLAATLGPPTPARAAGDPGLLISEIQTNVPGDDSPFEYVELIATRAIDFTATPYSVVFANNGIPDGDGWVNGGALTYGFSITSGSVAAGDVVYVGGSSMAPTGPKLRVINTLTTDGDRLGRANTGVLGNGGNNADGVAVFAANINTLNESSVPVDAIFFGGTVGAAVVDDGAAGYELPLNDRYDGGKLLASSFFAPEPVEGQALIATGSFNTAIGAFATAREWANGAPTDSASAVTLLSDPGANRPIVPECGVGPLETISGTPISRDLSASDADGTVTAAQILSDPVSGVSLSGFTPAADVGGEATVSLAVAADATVGAYNVLIEFANNDASPQTARCTVLVRVVELTRIRDIQGLAHVSPLVATVRDNATSFGEAVITPGIVTALRSNGFFMQDPLPDANPATSEGIFVFTGAAPTVQVGDALLVRGTASETRPGCAGSSCTAATDNDWFHLTTTQIVNATISVVASGQQLPAPLVIGQGGRVPPTAVIDDDTSGSVEKAAETVFDPANDGLDFYESLEGMLVQINDPVAVGPTRISGSGGSLNREIPVLADNGAGAGARTARGGIVARQGDFNPERVFLSDNLLGGDQGDPALPVADVADRLDGAVVGIMDYSNANYKLLLTAAAPSLIDGGLEKQTLAFGEPAANELTVATFNVENLAGNTPLARHTQVAEVIVDTLGAPDIIALQEIQDNDGLNNTPVVSASTTLERLTDAIVDAGGPAYEVAQIDPVDDQDGGQLGGNIRVILLYRTDRGLLFSSRPGGTATVANEVLTVAGRPQLRYNPGRIDPANSAFAGSRKPLAAEFTFNRRRIFVIANHFNSKAGDQPLFGRFQPPDLVTEAQRRAQATIVADFVDDIQAVDPNALVMVMGDLNDFEFAQPLTILEGAGLTTLIERLPVNERYTFTFQGNAQTLDHILVSQSALDALQEFAVAHINAEFADQFSNHDPQAARFLLNPPPNSAPTLSTIGVLTGATLGRDFSISYEALAAAANEADPDGDELRFRVEAVLDGSVTKNGTAVQPGVTTLGPGERLAYRPGRLGSPVAAFTVVASDSAAVSSSAVTVRVQVRQRVYLPLLVR